MMNKKMKITKKVFTQIRSFCPDLGEDQKKGKGLHSDSVRFCARFSTQILKEGAVAQF